MTLDGATVALVIGIGFGILSLARTDGSEYLAGVRVGIQACALTALIFGAVMWAMAERAIR